VSGPPDKSVWPTPTSVEVVSWYWHFVDGVWAVVFTLVYLVGR
jgi:heme/copper-type cytochrome/quinol oxidase subunit 3